MSFYLKEVTEDKFYEIEKASLHSKEYGHEVSVSFSYDVAIVMVKPVYGELYRYPQLEADVYYGPDMISRGGGCEE